MRCCACQNATRHIALQRIQPTNVSQPFAPSIMARGSRLALVCGLLLCFKASSEGLNPPRSLQSFTPPTCVRCTSGSGPCQGSDGSCFAYNVDATCPSGTEACLCPPCVAGTGGPCRSAGNVCTTYAAGTLLCPAGFFECFVNKPDAPSTTPSNAPTSSGSNSPSLSFSSSKSLSATTTPTPSQAPFCKRCGTGTSGPCQSIWGACWAYNSDGTCPMGSFACMCPSCNAGTFGPCHYADGSCSPYAAGTILCTAGSFECYVNSPEAPSTTPSVSKSASVTQAPSVSPSNSPSTSFSSSNTPSLSVSSSISVSISLSPSGAPVCRRCAPGTNGKCQSSDDKCWRLRSPSTTASPSPSPGYFGLLFEGGSCPTNSWQCACPVCTLGTTGPCHYPDGTCSGYFPGTTRCPYTSFECYVDTLAMPSESSSVSFTFSTSPSRTCSKSWSMSFSRSASLTATESATPTFNPILVVPARHTTRGPLSADAGFGVAVAATTVAVVGIVAAHCYCKRRKLQDGSKSGKQLIDEGGRGSSSAETAGIVSPLSHKPSKMNQVMPATPTNNDFDTPTGSTKHLLKPLTPKTPIPQDPNPSLAVEAQIRDDPSPYHHKAHHKRHESNQSHRSFIRDAEIASHVSGKSPTRQKRVKQPSPRRQPLPDVEAQHDAKFSPSKLTMVAHRPLGDYGGHLRGHMASEVPFALRGTRSISPPDAARSLDDSVTYATPTFDTYPHHTAFSPTKQRLPALVHRSPTSSHLHVSPSHVGRDQLLYSMDDGQSADAMDLPPAASVLQKFSLARRAPQMEHQYPLPHHPRQHGGHNLTTRTSGLSRLGDNGPGYDPVSNMFGSTAGYR